MNDRPLITARLFFGLIVLTLGVLWTLDNLGRIDASQIVRWWPIVALGWGLMRLFGVGVYRRPVVGAFWTVFGGISLLNTLDVIHASIFDLWPVFLIAVGAALVFRGWSGSAWTGYTRGASSDSSGLNVFAFMAGAERKVVAQDFRAGEVSVVMASAIVDLRPARLAENRAVVDVFAMWGGIELVVPVGWRVVGEVTPILGAFVDSMPPPTDPDAPTLVVRGLVLMGGVEVSSEVKRRVRYGIVDLDEERRRVRVSHGGVVVGGVVSDSRAGRERKHVKVSVGPGSIEVIREPRSAAPEPPGSDPAAGGPSGARTDPE